MDQVDQANEHVNCLELLWHPRVVELVAFHEAVNRWVALNRALRTEVSPSSLQHVVYFKNGFSELHATGVAKAPIEMGHYNECYRRKHANCPNELLDEVTHVSLIDGLVDINSDIFPFRLLIGLDALLIVNQVEIALLHLGLVLWFFKVRGVDLVG